MASSRLVGRYVCLFAELQDQADMAPTKYGHRHFQKQNKGGQMRVTTPRCALASSLGLVVATASLFFLLHWQATLMGQQAQQFDALQILMDASPAINASAYSALLHAAELLAKEQHDARPSRFQGKFPQFALALKTGAETAAARSAVQFMTFLDGPQNVLVFAEAQTHVGSHLVEDVYTNAYTNAQARIDAKRNATLFGKVMRRALDTIQVIGGQNAKTKGWTLDAHKNLPAYHLLRERFPNADWYIMFDDDTYVMLENLADFLGTLNASKPFYIGQPNRFKGCDGVKEFGHGPLFAQGGAGIIISRGGMNAMMPILDECIVKYKTCWAGDIRTGLCMRDAGVNITSNGQMHGSPPNAEFFFPDDPCTLPLTFHHSLPHQIQNLYDIEVYTRNITNSAPVHQETEIVVPHAVETSPIVAISATQSKNATLSNGTALELLANSGSNSTDATTKKRRNRSTTTMADIFAYLHLKNERTRMSVEEVRMRNNTDIRGRVGRSSECTAPEECLSACERWNECVGWVFDGYRCWMKKGPGRTVEAEIAERKEFKMTFATAPQKHKKLLPSVLLPKTRKASTASAVPTHAPQDTRPARVDSVVRTKHDAHEDSAAKTKKWSLFHMFSQKSLVQENTEQQKSSLTKASASDFAPEKENNMLKGTSAGHGQDGKTRTILKERNMQQRESASVVLKNVDEWNSKDGEITSEESSSENDSEEDDDSDDDKPISVIVRELQESHVHPQVPQYGKPAAPVVYAAIGTNTRNMNRRNSCSVAESDIRRLSMGMASQAKFIEADAPRRSTKRVSMVLDSSTLVGDRIIGPAMKNTQGYPLHNEMKPVLAAPHGVVVDAQMQLLRHKDRQQRRNSMVVGNGGRLVNGNLSAVDLSYMQNVQLMNQYQLQLLAAHYQHQNLLHQQQKYVQQQLPQIKKRNSLKRQSLIHFSEEEKASTTFKSVAASASAIRHQAAVEQALKKKECS
ncbi:hypothetical protein HDU82_000742 [Entophlyctis luteolus]|nr:hypothetical protein HDU82_000742 [Entophlyctis luteolus]